MALKVGDPIFNEKGIPGIIREVDTKKGHYTIDKSKEVPSKEFPQGYIQGLDYRDDFTNIMQEVSELKDPSDQMVNLQEKIGKLEQEPNPKSIQLASYLKAELFHIISINGLKPKTYQAYIPNS